MASRRRAEYRASFNYFIRRFFRIAPMFYVGMVLYLGLWGLGPNTWAPDGVKWWQVLTTITFTNDWHPATINAVVPGGWSIATEMSFYLLVPLLFRYVTSLAKAVITTTLALGVGYALSWAAQRAYAPLFPATQQYLVDTFAYYFWLPAQLSVFGLGLVVYRLSLAGVPEMRARLVAISVLAVALLWGLFILYAQPRFLPVQFTTSAAFALVAYALFLHPFRFFVNPLTMYVGKVSFSVYIVHFALIDRFHYWLPHGFIPNNMGLNYLASSITATMIAVALSFLTWRWIERPGQRLGGWLIEKLERQYARRLHTEVVSKPVP